MIPRLRLHWFAIGYASTVKTSEHAQYQRKLTSRAECNDLGDHCFSILHRDQREFLVLREFVVIMKKDGR